MTQTSSDNTARTLERSVHAIMLGMVIALMAWSGRTTWMLSETAARQDERVAQLITVTSELRNELRDTSTRFMPADTAGIYRQQINSRIDSLDSRVKKLEGN